jgi:hypothetical protein
MLVSTVALSYIIKRFLPPETSVSTLDIVLGGVTFIISIYLFYTKFGGLGVVGLLGSNFVAAIIGGLLP